MKMSKTEGLFLAMALCIAAASAPAVEPGSFEENADQFSWAVQPDPALPNVLLLGDSISVGYTLPVREKLKGKANVYRPVTSDGSKPFNCRYTSYSLPLIDNWLAMTPKWDVIHFNWGLHDLAHVNLKTKQNGPEIPSIASLEEYKANLQKLVDKMKATGAKLIFATTTTFPPGVNPCRLPEDVEKYNAVALEVMEKNGVAIDDLYSFTKDRLPELQRPVNVHFTEAGSKVIAEKIVESIAGKLPSTN